MRNLLQLLSARWYAGAFWLTPLIAPLLPTSPVLVGSGKLGTPCARMQTANSSWLDRIWLACVWLTGLASASDLQSFEAVRYAGEFGFAVKPPLGAGWVVGVGGIWSGGLGSGKFGTPCARMHFANASMLGCVGGLALLLGLLEDGVLLFAVLDRAVAVDAAAGALVRVLPPKELPLHPASSAAAATAASSTSARAARAR